MNDSASPRQIGLQSTLLSPLRARSFPLHAFAVVLTLLGATGTARAHEDDLPRRPTRHRAPSVTTSRVESARYAFFEVRIGPYRPAVDTEFSTGPGPFEQTFGTGPSLSFGFEADWQALKIPYLGSLGPGIAWSFANYSANARFADGSGISEHPTTFWVMPVEALLSLRIDVFSRKLNIPIVPYLKGGVVYAFWEGRDAGETSSINGIEGKGTEWGLAAHFGGMLELNALAPQAGRDMDISTGINSAYLFFEWMVSDVDSFNQGMQVGTSTWWTGLTIEY